MGMEIDDNKRINIFFSISEPAWILKFRDSILISVKNFPKLQWRAQVSSEEAIEPEIRCWKNRAKHEHFLYYSGVDETAC